MAMGFPTENVGNAFGFKVLPFWLLFWVISIACTAFFNIGLERGFYRYGYAWPMRQAADASRIIILNTSGQIGVNIGILLAWVAVSLLLYPFTCWLFQRSIIKQNVQDRDRVPKQATEIVERRQHEKQYDLAYGSENRQPLGYEKHNEMPYEGFSHPSHNISENRQKRMYKGAVNLAEWNCWVPKPCCIRCIITKPLLYYVLLAAVLKSTESTIT